MIFHVYPNCTGEWACWIEVTNSLRTKTMQWAVTLAVHKCKETAIGMAVKNGVKAQLLVNLTGEVVFTDSES